ncbi:uncharacterized protein LACBIDRAFT_297746 [Laccaria bicolor S238N-H82]|uniref:Predicted protein n=1 Tax=Laccaria bicolor (strain S238N-H82 / ATCC MYA-4686) TaxID=486041 RepID=B0DAS2_LACBS|nr:uncharacterized protein LACBIDRAFT_297746 [Laccaria bicolor S238N-H82]EDR08075.1 predicted protein [Laccaria bicolor S238N-H82]|eukprot:XP_001881145.1 predicted protein [Laccaria bicolor S238N-H82]
MDEKTSSPSERSRASEFYGFVAWTSTYLLFVIYVLWALLPDEYITFLGVYWYPSREWALLVPSWSIVIVVLTYVIYSSMAIASQPSFDDMSAIADTRASLPTRPGHNPYLGSASELYDIPIAMVNRVLYSEKRKG